MMEYVKDVTQEGFEQEVVQASRSVPVVMDFWAAWCAPCKTLMPVLERLAAEHNGAFVLARIDTEAQPELAARFGIRGIPNVKAMVDGKVVSEFSGAIPEAAVRQFLAKVVPSPAERSRRSARAALAEGDSSRAEALLREALALEPARMEARLDLVETLIARDAYAEASTELERIPERERDERAEALSESIALWERTRALPDAAALQSAVFAAPDDLESRWRLAERLAADGQHEHALEQLLEIVKRDRAELRDRARKLMVRIFGLCADDACVAQFRRSLASALY